MQNKKITVTIGIPAYNEEQNMENILLSLFRQRTETVAVKKIIINSDASSDKTNAIVKRLAKKYPIIKLIENKTRKGKYFRVNELFHATRTDALVILDADIALKGEDFLELLVQALMSDKKAVLAASHVELVQPTNFFEKIIRTTFFLGDCIRTSVPGYDVAANFHGAATAYKKEFVRKITIPPNLTDPHIYIYLCARQVKGFRYAPNAIVLQNPPTTLQDVKQMMQRSIGKEDKTLQKIFGKKMLVSANIIPAKAKMLGLLKSFMQQPLYTPFAVIMIFYFEKFAQHTKVNPSPIWEINQSTKKPIQYAK